MYDTVITVVGNVGSEVRQASTSGGAGLASFRLACTPRRQERETGLWVDGSTTWYRVTAWRGLADNVASSISKGDPVIVHGRLRTSAWEKDGRTGETLELDAITIGPDLTRGRAVFRRVVRVPVVAPGSASAAAEDEEAPDSDQEQTDSAASAGELTGVL